MNSLGPIFAICASGVILTAGCNKPETSTAPPPAPQTQSTQPSQSAPATPPSTPTAPMPPPDAPKDSAGPKPGQVNDHSNPAFKAGGKADTK